MSTELDQWNRERAKGVALRASFLEDISERELTSAVLDELTANHPPSVPWRWTEKKPDKPGLWAGKIHPSMDGWEAFSVTDDCGRLRAKGMFVEAYAANHPNWRWSDRPIHEPLCPAPEQKIFTPYSACPKCGGHGFMVTEQNLLACNLCHWTQPAPQQEATAGAEPDEKYLLSRGWEHVMTEDDGCDTWTFPWKLREQWPEWAKKSHGTQHYWDRDEALRLQGQLDSPFVQTTAQPAAPPPVADCELRGQLVTARELLEGLYDFVQSLKLAHNVYLPTYLPLVREVLDTPLPAIQPAPTAADGSVSDYIAMLRDAVEIARKALIHAGKPECAWLMASRLSEPIPTSPSEYRPGPPDVPGVWHRRSTREDVFHITAQDIAYGGWSGQFEWRLIQAAPQEPQEQAIQSAAWLARKAGEEGVPEDVAKLLRRAASVIRDQHDAKGAK